MKKRSNRPKKSRFERFFMNFSSIFEKKWPTALHHLHHLLHHHGVHVVVP